MSKIVPPAIGAAFLASMIVCLPAAAAAGAGLFAPGAMKEIRLEGVTCRIGRPVEVISQVSWGTRTFTPEGRPEMMFTHFFPTLARFPGGNLIALHCMEADSADDPFSLNGFQISRDGGASWGRRYNLVMQHNCVIFLPDGDDAMLMLPSELMQQTVGDRRNFTAPYTRFSTGGARLAIEPEGFRVLDWPWPIRVRPQGAPRPNWHVGLTVLGNALRVGHRILATAHAATAASDYACTAVVLISSEDDGHTWRYFSTVAPPDPALQGQPGYEGPCEPALIRLADGDLMAIFRVGSGERWHLGRCYSKDDGRTWTRPDVLPAFSVMPCLLRTAGGLLAISSGRPGIGLWVSADPRGARWQAVDIVAQHNAWQTDPSRRISSRSSRWETTSYTHMVEVAPNRLLLIYDRDAVIRPPDRPPASRDDVSRVFVMPIELAGGN